mgnify:CR=1 FL=1
MLEEKQIMDNWQNLLKFIDTKFDGDRKQKLTELYNGMDDQILMAPASGKKYFHSAFVGGYVHHVLNVIRCGHKIHELYKTLGMKIDYNEEELDFALLNHDLGKVGVDGKEYYLPSEDDWRIRREEVFTINPDLHYMKHDHRSLFLLQSHGVSMSEVEFLAILLHGGLFEDANKSYFITYNLDFQMKTNLPYVLHYADAIATRYEYEQYLITKNKKTSNLITSKPKKKSAKVNKDALSQITTRNESLPDLEKSFADLFNEVEEEKK